MSVIVEVLIGFAVVLYLLVGIARLGAHFPERKRPEKKYWPKWYWY